MKRWTLYFNSLHSKNLQRNIHPLPMIVSISKVSDVSMFSPIPILIGRYSLIHSKCCLKISNNAKFPCYWIMRFVHNTISDTNIQRFGKVLWFIGYALAFQYLKQILRLNKNYAKSTCNWLKIVLCKYLLNNWNIKPRWRMLHLLVIQVLSTPWFS